MSKTIVVTGGSTGIGGAVVQRLHAAGCAVHVFDVVAPQRDDVRFTHCDLGSVTSIDGAVAALPGAIDVLINVAGVAAMQPPERTVAINFLGLRHLTEQLLTQTRSGGSVINVASSAARDWRTREAHIRAFLNTNSFADGIAWLSAHRETWIDNPYKFSKQCTAAYTYTAAGVGIARGVRVNCVNPGSTETQLTPAFRELVGPGLYDWGVAQIGRHGTPDDIAEVIEFLAIGQCRWLNGVEILVDGGYVAGTIGGWINTDEAPRTA